MCIIFVKPKNKKINENFLEDCWLCNSDGMGMMYIKKNKLIIIKELYDFNLFLNKISQQCENIQEIDVVFHFRSATKGNISYNNTQPFRINRQTAFAHNGTFANLSLGKNASDSAIFRQKLKQKLPISHIIQDNKIVFMSVKSGIEIINENLGNWEDGCWTSKQPFNWRNLNGTY